MNIKNGQSVILVLHSPREKIWGVLQEITPAGIYVRGIDLNAFEEFIRSHQSGDFFYGLSSLFVPLWRVERVNLDETNGDIPSLTEQFVSRTGVEEKFFADL